MSGQPRRKQLTNPAPLVSVFMFVRNGSASVRRAIESVRAQSYKNIEFVVQDGVSTDGTQEIVRSYGSDIKIVSEPDSGPSEGLWRALHRCTGEFIGSCLADEELMPNAVEQAVEIMRRHPDVGAITGDAIITDLEGVQTGFWKSGPFNLVDYLLCDYTPYFVSSFFRRSALLDAGLHREQWGLDRIEFELWCRLARRSRVMYVPETFAKYGSHPGQSSSNPKDALRHFKGRLDLIGRICDEDALIGGDPLFRAFFIWGHARAFVNHAVAIGKPDLAQSLFEAAREFAGLKPSPLLEGVAYDETEGYLRAAQSTWTRAEGRLPAPVRAVLGRQRLEGWRSRLEASMVHAKFASADLPAAQAMGVALGLRQLPPSPGNAFPFPSALTPLWKARMYSRLAQGYVAEGRLAEACDTWLSAARLTGLA